MAAALRGAAFLAAGGCITVVFFGGMVAELLSLLGSVSLLDNVGGVLVFFNVLYLAKIYLFSY